MLIVNSLTNDSQKSILIEVFKDAFLVSMVNIYSGMRPIKNTKAEKSKVFSEIEESYSKIMKVSTEKASSFGVAPKELGELKAIFEIDSLIQDTIRLLVEMR